MDPSLKEITASVEFSFTPTTYNDPKAQPKVIVASFHTHYPLCWTDYNYENQFHRPNVGPEKNDIEIANDWLMP